VWFHCTAQEVFCPAAAGYAREKKVPYLGLCLGMQVMCIDFARGVLNHEDANSSKFDRGTEYPVIDLMLDQRSITDMGGTMRLALYPYGLKKSTKAAEAYEEERVEERHRHHFEFNNKFKEDFEKGGMVFSGMSPDGKLVEIAEIKDHPFMVASQFHPEFLSRPMKPHPLFLGLIKAAKERNRKK
jgi:CTP synthase